MMLKKRFDTSNYEVDRPLSTGKNNNLFYPFIYLKTKKIYFSIIFFLGHI